MKKTYMIPSVEEIKIAEMCLLSGSGVNASGLDGMDGFGGTDDDGSVTPSAPGFIELP